jgi:hypothetical protein
MPFEHWEDRHAQELRRTKGPRWADDPEFYVRQHFYTARDGSGPYLLNAKCRALMNKLGPFDGHYVDGEELVNKHRGETAYILCPGPTMDRMNLQLLRDKLTISVNSAGFRFPAKYWVMAETGYAHWFVKQKDFPKNRVMVSTARVAIVFRALEIKARKEFFEKVYVIRWEEEFVSPPRTPAVSTTDALITAWEMGCPRAVVIGLDLSKTGGPYVKGVPHTRDGAANPFDEQIRALSQFQLPDFEVVNGSPLSHEALPNFTTATYEEIEAECSGSPADAQPA